NRSIEAQTNLIIKYDKYVPPRDVGSGTIGRVRRFADGLGQAFGPAADQFAVAQGDRLFGERSFHGLGRALRLRGGGRSIDGRAARVRAVGIPLGNATIAG